MGRLICEGAHRSQMVRHPFILRLFLRGHARLVIRMGVRDGRCQNGGHMTFSGRQILLRNTTVHVWRHCGSTPLRKGCEVVILIETGLSLRPRKVVPL